MSDIATYDSKSRYKVPGEEYDGQPSPDHITDLVKNLRVSFDSEKTKSKEWRESQLKAFGRMLDECEEEFSEALFKDLHKSRFEGFLIEMALIKAEVQECLNNLDKWMAPKKKKGTGLNFPSWSTTQRDPLGVVLILGAWNYPIQLSLCPMVGAIAAGNCVIMKPGSYAKESSHAMVKLVNKYMDSDCIRVIEGNRKVTTALLEQKFDKIFFTGSGHVGRIVATAAAKHLTPCALELGGKSPTVVDSSANLKHAAKRLAWGTYLNGGQTCVRPDFLMVHEAVADKFFVELREAVKELYGDNPKDTEFFGRCINESAFNRLADLIQTHKLNIVFGGKTDAADKYVEPTLLDFGNNIRAFGKERIMQDEIFGPILPAVRYKNLEDVVQFIRHLPTGKPLALYAFGTDTAFIESIKTRTTSGGLCINDTMMHLANHHIPFGGVGNSGMGSYHGKYSFDCFSHEKGVLEKSQTLDETFFLKYLLGSRFPPYTNSKKKLVSLVANPKIEGFFETTLSTFKLAAFGLASYTLLQANPELFSDSIGNLSLVLSDVSSRLYQKSY